uniref:Uncharacterized protein n=1 Tax=Arundo donax TaxID=35708 RepID=A0A0A9L3M9_ARUDO
MRWEGEFASGCMARAGRRVAAAAAGDWRGDGGDFDGETEGGFGGLRRALSGGLWLWGVGGIGRR